MSANSQRPEYGVDAPNVLRGFWLFGTACMAVSIVLRMRGMHDGLTLIRVPHFQLFFPTNTFLVMGVILLVEGVLFLIYVKYGKFLHRDAMLAMHSWTGNEHVLDVGCGRGLLLAGAAKRLTTGHATGIDIWSNVDMAANSSQATQRNLDLEGVAARCDLQSMPAQAMTFSDASFDLVVSNLCIHNISKKADRDQACREIVRVLKPGGQALISDYKNTAAYARVFSACNCEVEKKWGSFLTTFPPLRTVIVRKPG
jgi:arsenite methyltransferase